MKTFNAIFKTKRGNIDPNSVESYYGHGAQMHQHQGHSHLKDAEHTDALQYGCPMKCEGDKTYDHPGNCPVCNMKLVPISQI